MAYEFNHYYELQNVQTRKYVNILGNHEDGTVKNGETVNLFARTDNPDQRWALENYGGSGSVRIVLQRGEGWYALNYHVSNANCIVWHLNTAEDTDTVITTIPVDGKANRDSLQLKGEHTHENGERIAGRQNRSGDDHPWLQRDGRVCQRGRPGNHENRHRPDHERLCRAPGAGNTGVKQNREQAFSKKAAPGFLVLRVDKTSISCH